MALAARARPSVEHHPRRRAALALPPMSQSRTPKPRGAILTCVRTDSLAPAFFQAGNQVVAHRGNNGRKGQSGERRGAED